MMQRGQAFEVEMSNTDETVPSFFMLINLTIRIILQL